jgi:hypothetical protein
MRAFAFEREVFGGARLRRCCLRQHTEKSEFGLCSPDYDL